jgi:3-methyladenine DNA glycosylase AlkD
MTAQEIMQELKVYGNASTKNTFLNHGAPEPLFGVKVGDLKKIQKKVKKDHALSLELYDTGNSDAMYLAGLIADENKITKAQLNKWAKNASWYMISEYTVPWIAAESPHGFELGMEWIDSKKPNVASTGWATLSSVVSLVPNENLDLQAIESLLEKAASEVHKAPNRVRYTMNGFIISVGSYVKPLHKKACAFAKKIGKVQVDVGGTACKVPFAEEYIPKVVARGSLDKKRKMARC